MNGSSALSGAGETRAQGQAAAVGERDGRLDLLKVSGALAVVVLHASMDWAVRVVPDSPSWWLANLANAASRFGSAIFVMVAGAVLLQRASEKAPLKFVLTRWSRLVPAVLFWSVFYLAWRRWNGIELSWRDMVSQTALGVPSYHLWFVFMMLGLYALVPPLRLVARTATDRRAQYFCLAAGAAMTCLVALNKLLVHPVYTGFIELSPLYMVYLLGGYLLYRDRFEVPSWVLAAVSAACIVVMAIGVALLHPRVGDRAFFFMYSDRSPPAMLLTACAFIAALRLRAGIAFPRIVVALASVSLGIYALHPFWMDVMGMAGWPMPRFGGWWIVPTAVLFFLSAAAALAMKQVPGLRRVVM